MKSLSTQAIPSVHRVGGTAVSSQLKQQVMAFAAAMPIVILFNAMREAMQRGH